MKLVGRRKILIAPLDWGLGHATRCIPVINELIIQGHEVIIAAQGPIKTLLQKEFSALEYLPLKGYNIKYSKTKPALVINLIWQTPKILYSIFMENRWIKRVIKKNKIDIVISDNRFGLYNKEIYSVFITHQLFIKTPFLKKWLQKLNYYFINKYDECWVPDFEGEPNLAGILSHPAKLPVVPIRYIGWLSRFEKAEEKDQKYLLILISGPEPQRTVLEEKIIKQLENFSSPVLIVSGLPGNNSLLKVKKGITAINHLPAYELEEAILQSSFVIARSGYSTVMDLLKLKKKTILIPTPGQTEQEYLAKHLLKQQLAFSEDQQTFDLEKSLQKASVFTYLQYDGDATNIFKDAVCRLNSLVDKK